MIYKMQLIRNKKKCQWWHYFCRIEKDCGILEGLTTPFVFSHKFIRLDLVEENIVNSVSHSER